MQIGSTVFLFAAVTALSFAPRFIPRSAPRALTAERPTRASSSATPTPGEPRAAQSAAPPTALPATPRLAASAGSDLARAQRRPTARAPLAIHGTPVQPQAPLERDALTPDSPAREPYLDAELLATAPDPEWEQELQPSVLRALEGSEVALQSLSCSEALCRLELQLPDVSTSAFAFPPLTALAGAGQLVVDVDPHVAPPVAVAYLSREGRLPLESGFETEPEHRAPTAAETAAALRSPLLQTTSPRKSPAAPREAYGSDPLP